MSATSSHANEWHIKFRTAEEKSAVVRKVKTFAVSRDLTIAEALGYLADLAGGPGADDLGNQKQSGTNLHDEVPTEAEIERLLGAGA